MRVLLIAHKNPYPPRDGGSMAIANMIDGLLLNGIHLDVLLMNPSKVFQPFLPHLVPKQIRRIKAIPINTDLHPIKALKNLIFQKEDYFTSRFYDKNFEQELISWLQSNQYNIIQLESIFSAVYLPVIKKYSNAKIILSAHNIEHQIWQRIVSHEKNPFKKYYLIIQSERLKKFEEINFKAVDGITAIAEHDKQNILSVVRDKPIVVTPNGMDIKKFEVTPIEMQDIHTIFFLGSLDWIPNQQGVVWFLDNVWPKVLESLPNLQLVIAGKKIPEWMKNRKDKNTCFYSDVPDSKELYHRYAVMIVPLLAGSGIRVKIIEGMAYGKCIVSTSIGAEGIPYTHGENIIIADTPEDFAQAIVRLIHHPEKIQQIQQKARQLAEHHYDREKVYLPIVNLYHKLVK
jgi:glycosyltransferase involved in cell wall biosynthesis